MNNKDPSHEKTVSEFWNTSKYEYQKTFDQFWQSTSTLTSIGRPVDGLLFPINTVTAYKLGDFRDVGAFYTPIFNLWITALWQLRLQKPTKILTHLSRSTNQRVWKTNTPTGITIPHFSTVPRFACKP